MSATAYRVRVTWEGEVLSEAEIELQATAWARFESTVSDYRRRNDDESDGVTVQLISPIGDEIMAETTFAMGGEF